MRQQLLDELILAIPIHTVSIALALRAGQIGGENSAKGLQFAMSDLLIGVTTLYLGYRVATANERHFRMVPGLDIAGFRAQFCDGRPRPLLMLPDGDC